MRFYDYHPFTLIVFFASVIAFTMITMNPFLLLLSFFGAFFSVLTITKKTDMGIYLIIFLAICLSNPFFSHNGETVLFYLFDQRITLEALFYGVGAGLLIISVIYWFRLFSFVFTQDKLTWLIGRISPKLCVVFCMALRFVPLFRENAKSIYSAQLSMGVFNTHTIKGKFKLTKNVFSALVSLSVENAIETADTMRSRGFDNKKRSAYSLLSFSKKDIALVIITIVADCAFSYLLAIGEGVFYYYPAVRFNAVTPKTVAFYSIFAFLCFMPVINEAWEDLRWKYLISKI